MSEPMADPRGLDPEITQAIKGCLDAFGKIATAFDAMARFVLPKAFRVSRVLAHAKRHETLRKHRRYQDARRVAAKAGRRERTGRPSDKAAGHA